MSDRVLTPIFCLLPGEKFWLPRDPDAGQFVVEVQDVHGNAPHVFRSQDGTVRKLGQIATLNGGSYQVLVPGRKTS